MKPIACALLTAAVLVPSLAGREQTARDQEGAPALHARIAALDRRYFDAYNACDLATQEALLSDDLEFYHDRSGLQTSRLALLESIERNICGKVTRELVAGSLEVYPLGEDGAVAIGLHRFRNAEEPDAPAVASRFVTIWRDEGDAWRMSRVISLHSAPDPR
jgi:ketosteroid isomerase-like protein